MKLPRWFEIDTPVGKYNPEKARQVLDQAGWKLDGNARKKDGMPLEITLVIPTGIATSKQTGELVQNMLGQTVVMPTTSRLLPLILSCSGMTGLAAAGERLWDRYLTASPRVRRTA